jgi:hypothetical protein
MSYNYFSAHEAWQQQNPSGAELFNLLGQSTNLLKQRSGKLIK